MESSICTVCSYCSKFSLVCKLNESGLHVMHLISDHLRFMGRIDIGDFY